MKQLIHNIYVAHQEFWTKHDIFLLLTSFGWFIFAIIVQHFAYLYIDGHVIGTHVGDVILDNLPVVNLDFFIVQGALLSTLLIIFLFAIKPRYLPFGLKSLALFIIVRSFFISLTHLGVNLHQITLNTNSIGFSLYEFLYNAKNDFFFSGHVGAACLFGFIFWNEKIWGTVFFVFAFVFGVSMLFAHMHYSIDVFAAPFIVFSIFTIAKKIFKSDYLLI
jgi:hypothetical protein